ncbi:MAG: type II toxin-antitoxin system VapC family toxin [Fibromonadales bacterium]|nr:type II toxin-antitoxin system VapC family toxin [Fibromonadales bacterium]
MRKKVYIETTVPSVLTARPSRDIRKLYRQEVTREFWEYERQKYDLYISQYVWAECEKGDENAAKKRLDLIKDIPSLSTNDDIESLAEEYFKYLNVPDKAKTDCFHLAICVIEKIDYLVSWNMTHLGRPAFGRVATFNGIRNLWLPDLVTPDLLMDIEKEEAENGV